MKQKLVQNSSNYVQNIGVKINKEKKTYNKKIYINKENIKYLLKSARINNYSDNLLNYWR